MSNAHHLSYSELNTHSPPTDSNAILLPPIPANKSMNLKVVLLLNITFRE